MCPGHCLSTSGLSCDATLKMAKIELISVPDILTCMYSLKSARGEMSYIFNKYSKANSKYLKFYDPIEESKHYIYLDVNMVMQYLNFFH